MAEHIPEIAEFLIHAYYHANPGPAFNLSHAVQIRFVNLTGLDLKPDYTTDNVSYHFAYGGNENYHYPPTHVTQAQPNSKKIESYMVSDFIATTNTWQVDIKGTVRYLDDSFRKGEEVLRIEFFNPLVSINENRCDAIVSAGEDSTFATKVIHREGYMNAFYDIFLCKC